ncbi:Cell division protein FtsK [Candidatus Paraburkholderia kirkii]|nr:Cell division protein FtsK [Candidatus Paraburkholderia kirkii]
MAGTPASEVDWREPPTPPLLRVIDEPPAAAAKQETVSEAQAEIEEEEERDVAGRQVAGDEFASPSNVVRLPVATAAETTPHAPPPIVAPTSAATPAPSETRTAVRGFTPTEFEFHAPHASAVELPTLDLLESASGETEPVSEARLNETGQLIEQRLQEFKVPVTVVGASAGPVITRFEVEPALGVRGSQIVGLMKDLSRGLGLTSIRVVETIPGKICIGLELPNQKRQMIRLSEILEDEVYRASKSNLTIAMGKDIIGNPVVTDLAKAPHMLVAGTTGSGKSVAINAMILSLLYKAKPEDVRLIMIDPKMLELSVYEGIPHLLAPVVTDMKLASNALNWCVGEIEKRYRLMSAVGVRNLQGFNQKIRNTEAAGRKLTNPFSLTPDAPEPLSTLPLIVVIIDELADLMMVTGKQIEQLIARLAQKARAAGIHLILTTQRPSVDVITGLIKANIPTRVAFQVSSKIDSRTILDQMGAESLLGAGDMLFLPPGMGYPQRVHGAFVADDEVHRVVEHLKQFGEPEYEEGIFSGPTSEGGATPDLSAMRRMPKPIRSTMRPWPSSCARGAHRFPRCSGNCASVTTARRVSSSRWKRPDSSRRWAATATAKCSRRRRKIVMAAHPAITPITIPKRDRILRVRQARDVHAEDARHERGGQQQRGHDREPQQLAVDVLRERRGDFVLEQLRALVEPFQAAAQAVEHLNRLTSASIERGSAHSSLRRTSCVSALRSGSMKEALHLHDAPPHVAQQRATLRVSALQHAFLDVVETVANFVDAVREGVVQRADEAREQIDGVAEHRAFEHGVAQPVGRLQRSRAR